MSLSMRPGRFLEFFLISLLFIAPLQASTIVVNSISDTASATADTLCTLREAITASNNNATYGDCVNAAVGATTISFSGLIGTGPFLFDNAMSAYPTITRPVTIDGYTQASAVQNSSASAWNGNVTIQLRGNSGAYPAFVIGAAGGGTVIRGLSIGNFGGGTYPAGGVIVINASNCTISGNNIGVRVASNGSTTAANVGNTNNFPAAILITPPGNSTSTSSNVIGGTTPSARNVISAVDGSGIKLDNQLAPSGSLTGTTVNANAIQGNLLGVNGSGNSQVAIKISQRAIDSMGATNTLIGGTTGTNPTVNCAGACNVIASNAWGVLFQNDGTATITGNYIGVNASGTAAIGSTYGAGSGINVNGGTGAGSITIGGGTVNARNIISGWAGSGIDVAQNPGIATVYIYGNYIGVDKTGLNALPNGYSGIHVQNGSPTIGGTTAGQGNVISGNGVCTGCGDGIYLEGAWSAKVQGNKIGVGADGVTPIPNNRLGIYMSSSGNGAQPPDANTIGADTPGGPGGNIIANNLGINTYNGAGINVYAGHNHRILANSMYGNVASCGGCGPTPLTSNAIDLGGDGPTANDNCDADSATWANDYQNFPVLTKAVTSGSQTTISGTMNSLANQTYAIEFYANPPTDPRQLTTFLGTTTVMTNGACTGSFSAVVPAGVASGSYITATATIMIAGVTPGSTSEASDPILVSLGTKQDFQADGKADLMWRSGSSGANSQWLQSGSVTVTNTSLPTVADTNFKVVGIADFQGDGKADVLWRNTSTGANVMWLMNGPSVVVNVPITTVADTNWKVAGVGDLQGDGKADIIWRNTATGDNSLWFMDGINVAVSVSLPSVPDTTWQIAGVGDFQGDGKDDIFWRNSVSGANSVWLMNGGAVAVGVAMPAVADLNWKVVGVGDFQGDGKADLLWRNSSTGGNVIWFMNGLSYVAAVITPVADPNQRVQKVADFQGDGKADIVWRNISTGNNSIWFMDGPTLALSASLTSVPDTNFNIVP